MRADLSAATGPFELGPWHERYTAHCERDGSDGGGWTSLLRIHLLRQSPPVGHAVYTPTAAAINTPSLVDRALADNVHKVADREAVLAMQGPWPGQERPLVVLRVRSDADRDMEMSWYLKGRLGKFSDPQHGLGLLPVGTRVELCHAAAIADCTWTSHVAAAGGFDIATLEPKHPDADEFGIYTDKGTHPPDGDPDCLGEATASGDRCFKSHRSGVIEHRVSISVRALGAACGDGVVDPALEECDDGNTAGGDGCSADCVVEWSAGWRCSAPEPAVASRCHLSTAGTCGNGVRETGEQCDDGNDWSRDGCSAVCRVEYGYTCPPAGGVCSVIDYATCDHVLRREALPYSEVRKVGHSSDQVAVHCALEAASGMAWTPVLHYGTGATGEYTPADTPAAIGNPSAEPGTGSSVNMLARRHHTLLAGPAGTRAVWRFKSSLDPDGKEWFVITRGRWYDLGRGARILHDTVKVDDLHTPVEVCRSTDFATCSWYALRDFSTITGFDVFSGDEFGVSANDCSRIHFDRVSSIDRPHCRTSGTIGNRCFNAGWTCLGSFPNIPELTISVKPACTICGDGCTDPFEGYEQCDDGNTSDGDGCSSNCMVEQGWTCPHSDYFTSICTPDPVFSGDREASCYDHVLNGRVTSGVYAIYPPRSPYRSQRWVYCDMATDSDGAGSDPAGGWTLLSAFSQSAGNDYLPKWKYDRIGRLALWIEGSARGPPLLDEPSELLVGRDVDAWSHNWYDHVERSLMLELRQRCTDNHTKDEVDIVFDAGPTTEYLKQVGPTNSEYDRTWVVTNFRDVANAPGITWHRQPTDINRFWLPFKETDGTPPSGNAWQGCNGYASTGCCTCTDATLRRYGSVGVMGSAADFNDPGFTWMPIFYTGINTGSLAYKYQQNTVWHSDGTAVQEYPVTCRYYHRPKPFMTQLPTQRRTTPSVHFTFDTAHVSGTTIQNQGSLGSAADANLVGTCSGTTGIKTGKNAQGVEFDGNSANCHVNIPSPVLPMVQSPWTIMFWFKFSALPTVQTGQLFFFRGDGDATWENSEFQIFTRAGTTSTTQEAKYTMGMVGNSQSWAFPVEGSTPADNNWHHYAYISNGYKSGSAIYVDGEKMEMHYNVFPNSNGAGWRNMLMDPSHTVRLGGNGPTSSHSSQDAFGTMDDFKWFTVALTRNEIRTVSGITLIECDDGNDIDGDGCSGGIVDGPLWTCTLTGTPCERGLRRAVPIDDRAPRTLLSATCSHLMASSPLLPDGVYSVGIDGNRDSVWCERGDDPHGQEGWTVFLHKGAGGASSYTPSAREIGTPASQPRSLPGYHKLADDAVRQAQRGLWGQRPGPRHVMRFRNNYGESHDGKHLYVRGAMLDFVDTQRGWGVFKQGAIMELCRAASLSACTGAWVAKTQFGGDTLDTNVMHATSFGFNDAARVFFDHYTSSTEVSCWLAPGNSNDGTRCLSQGSAAGASIDHGDVSILTVGPLCGDAVVDPALESCDDGNAASGDGCSDVCRVESGWRCSVPVADEPSRCWRVVTAPATPLCGNGELEATGEQPTALSSEECDDGNTSDGDGCSSLCRVEYGYTCDGAPGTACAAIHHATCEHMYRADPTTHNADGVKTLGPAHAPFTAWCKRITADGGAMMKVYHHTASVTSYTPTESEIGTGASSPATAGMHKVGRFAVLRQYGGLGTVYHSEWEWISNEASNPWYFRFQQRYSDRERGWGLPAHTPGEANTFRNAMRTEKCYAANIAACDAGGPTGWFKTYTRLGGIAFDSMSSTDVSGDFGGNDCNRIFFDYKNYRCYDMGLQDTTRCFSAGSSCTSHKRITSLVVSMRPMCTKCGDGCTDPFPGYEQCDDGNTADGDGCSSTCRIEPGWVCPASHDFKSICTKGTYQRTCLDHRREGALVTGVYAVHTDVPTLPHGTRRHVLCDMSFGPADPAFADPSPEIGGWTLMMGFAISGDTKDVSMNVYESFFRYALWTEGSSHAPPLTFHQEDDTQGRDLMIQSHDWREHFHAGRTYELDQYCTQANNANHLELIWDVVASGAVRQTGGSVVTMETENWRARNRRILANVPALPFPTDGVTESKVSWFWLPFVDDGTQANPVVTGCGQYATSCCTCTTVAARRYGNAGIVADDNTLNSVSITWMPHLYEDIAFSVAAAEQDPGNTGYQYAGGAVFPLRCQYWARPKPLATPPPLHPRLTPLVHFSFDTVDLRNADTNALNLGSLGASADALFVGDCHPGLGSPLEPQGCSNQGIAFTGTSADCYVQIPHQVMPLTGTAWTIMFWFKFATAPSANPVQTLVLRGNGDGTWDPSESMIYISPSSSGFASEALQSLSFVTYGAPDGFVGARAGDLPDDTDWHHYAISARGTERSHTMYVDGVRVGSHHNRGVVESLDHVVRGQGQVDFGVFLGGPHHSATPNAAHGTMDDFAWYPVELTPDEVMIAAANTNEVVSFVASAFPASEASGEMSLKITVTGGCRRVAPITVEIAFEDGTAVSGEDYDGSKNVTVTIPRGQNAASLELKVIFPDDDYDEGTEQFTIRLQNPRVLGETAPRITVGAGPLSVATVSITNEPYPYPLDSTWPRSQLNNRAYGNVAPPGTVPLPTGPWVAPVSDGGKVNDPVVLADGVSVVITKRTTVAVARYDTLGTMVWETIMPTGNTINRSPSLANAGATVFVGTDSGHVYGLNAATGAIFLDADLQCPGGASSPVSMSSGDAILYAAFETSTLFAVDAVTGVSVWNFTTPANVANNVIQMAPTVARDGSVYFGDKGGRIFKLDGVTGALLWQIKSTYGAVRHVANVFALAPGRTLIASDFEGIVRAFDSQTGSLRWIHRASPNRLFSAPVVPRGGRHVLLATQDGTAWKLELTTGSVVWSIPFPAGTSIGGATGTLTTTRAGDELYVFGTGAGIMAVRVDNAATAWLYPAATQTYAAPAVRTDGSLYVLDGGTGNALHHIVPYALVRFTQPNNLTVSESARNASITVERTGLDVNATFDVDIFFIAGTATDSGAGKDFDPSAASPGTTVHFGTGVTSVVVTVPIVFDSDRLEGDETFQVGLGAVTLLSGGEIGGVNVSTRAEENTMTVTITDAVPPPGPPTAPAAPSVSTAAFAASGSVSVSWPLPNVNQINGGVLTTFSVYRDGVLVSNVGATATSLVDPGPIAEGASVSYTLSFNTTFGASPVSVGTTVTLPIRSPLITAVSPSTVPAPDGGVPVTVHGLFFGAAPSELTWVLAGAVNMTAGFTIAADMLSVTIVAPPGSAGTTAQVVLFNTLRGTSPTPSPAASFTYVDVPAVSAVSPAEAGRLGGIVVDVRGDHFGALAGDLVAASLAGVACAPATWRNSQHVECIAAEAPGPVVGPVVVTTVDALSASVAALPVPLTAPTFSYHVPSITAVEPLSLVVGTGGVLTVRGSRLGVSASELVSLTVAPGGVACSPATYVSSVELLCTVTPGSVPVGVATITVNTTLSGVNLTPSPDVLFLPQGGAPFVTSVTPTRGPAAGGTLLTVTGINFGDSAADLALVSIAGAGACVSFAHVSNTTATCVTAASPSPDAELTGRIVVTTSGGGASVGDQAVVFTYDAEPIPIAADTFVTAIVPSSGSIAGGTSVTLFGVGFGASPKALARVSFGPLDSPRALYLSPTSAVATSPASSYPPQAVAVTYHRGDNTSLVAAGFDSFAYVYGAPVVANAKPRVLPMTGAVPVTIYGSNFGPSAPAVLAVTIGGAPCLSAQWVREGMITCGSAPAAADIVTGSLVDVPIEVTVGALVSGPTRLAAITGTKGLRYSAIVCGDECEVNSICDDATGVCGVTCSPGFVGAPTCAIPSVQLVFAGGSGQTQQQQPVGEPLLITVSEDGGAGVERTVQLELLILEPPDQGDVSFEAVVLDATGSTDQTSIDIARAQITIEPSVFIITAAAAGDDDGSQSVPITLSGVQDEMRDGNFTVAVEVRLKVGAGRLAASPVVPRARIAVIDSLPTITAFLPKTVPLVGTNVTISGDHWDPYVALYIEGNSVGEFTVTRAAAAAVSAQTRSSITLAQVPTQTTLVPIPGTLSDVQVVSSHLLDEGGYHNLRVVNLWTGTFAQTSTLLFATNDCPFEGQFGTGKECKDCPTGGYCPGGFRVWPLPGYWNPSEDSGFVTKCVPETACQGCIPSEGVEQCYAQVASPCATGYTGFRCSECVTDGEVKYFRAASGECEVCPEDSTFFASIAAMIALWLTVAVAGVALSDREVLGHLTGLIMAIQEVAGVGQLVSHRLPAWIKAVYQALWLFSGDISFVNPSCGAPSQPVIDMWIALAFLVAVGVPMHVLCLVCRLCARSPERKIFYQRRGRRLLSLHALLAYLGVASRSLSMFSCATIGGELRLTLEPAHVCFQGLHLPGVISAAVVVLVFVIGYPATTLYQLHRNSSRLYTDEAYAEVHDAPYEPFKPRWRHSWLAELGINVVLATCASVLSQHPNLQIGIAVTAFSTLLIFLIAARPFHRTYENVVMSFLQVANILAMTIIYLAGEGKIEPGSIKEKGLLYSLIALATIVLLSFLAVLVAGLVFRKDPEKRRVAGYGDDGLDPSALDFADFEYAYEYDYGDEAGVDNNNGDQAGEGVYDQFVALFGLSPSSGAGDGERSRIRKRVRVPTPGSAALAGSAAAAAGGGEAEASAGRRSAIPPTLDVLDLPATITARPYEPPGMLTPVLRALGLGAGPPSTPAHWTSGDKAAKGTTVDVTAAMKDSVQKLIDDTCRAEHLGTGNDARASGHTRLVVTRVLRIENQRLWDAYRFKTGEVARTWADEEAAVPTLAAATDAASGALPETETLWPDAGEKILFHGTSAEIAGIIATRGFDARVARAGMFSDRSGIYLAAHSSKADDYASPSGGDGGECEMIIARAAVGCPFVAQHPLRLPRPPCVKGHTGACRHVRFDSLYAPTTDELAGAALNKHPEIVLFDGAMVFPAYRVSYVRE